MKKININTHSCTRIYYYYHFAIQTFIIKKYFVCVAELICEAEYLSVDPYMRVYVSRINSLPAPMIGTQVAKYENNDKSGAVRNL